MLKILAQIYGPVTLDWRTGSVWRTSQKHIEEEGELISNLSCVAGHFPYGIHSLLSFDCQYFSILRHPIDRILSLFYHNRSQKGQGYQNWRKLGFDETTSLYDYVISDKDISVLNAQTAQIAGIPFESKAPDQADFKLACEHMDNIVVGVTDQFEKSLDVFTQRLNWPKRPDIVYNNVHQHPGVREQDPKAREAILERNAYDLMLYDMAKGRLLKLG